MRRGTATPIVAGQGCIELRYDQSNVVTDASVAAGVRPLRRGEVQYLLRILEQYLVVDQDAYQ